MLEAPVSFYDETYQRMDRNRNTNGWNWLAERVDKIAPLVVGDSVLDLGCGLATIANAIDVDVEYVGIDYSEVAIEWNKKNVKHPLAIFAQRDIMDVFATSAEVFDTVLLLEVLEHVGDPYRVCREAIKLAKRRLIVTVPRNMVGGSHIHPRWTKRDLRNCMVAVDYFELFGGPTDNRWWVAYRDFLKTDGPDVT